MGYSFDYSCEIAISTKFYKIISILMFPFQNLTIFEAHRFSFAHYCKGLAGNSESLI